ncbi:hypothetical protein ES705_34330 [subsurface metagenome]
MSGKFNYELRYKYPHLIGEDKDVWDRFVQKYPHKFDTVDYDVHVGTGIVDPDEPESKISEQWKELTRKRIDVIGWKVNFATIIEVKKRVGLASLGQALGYRFLYQLENPKVLLSPSLIVCSQIDNDDQIVLDHFGILYEVV